MTEEQITKIIKNAVEAALVDVHEKLDELDARFDEIESTLDNIDTADESDVTGALDYLSELIESDQRRRDLEAGRAELRQARLLGKVAS